MSHTPQCRKVPLGASGSSTTKAKLLVPGGGSDQLRGGDLPPPSQVNSAGIAPPFWKALLLRLNCAAALSGRVPHAALAARNMAGAKHRRMGPTPLSVGSTNLPDRCTFRNIGL